MKVFILGMILSLFSFCAWAEDPLDGPIDAASVIDFGAVAPHPSHFSVDLNVGQTGGDLGVGVSATSPYVLSNTLALRFSLANAFFTGTPLGAANSSLMPYINVRLTPVMAFPMLSDKLRAYVLAGFSASFGNSSFTTSSTIPLTGLLVAGAEYLPSPNSPYSVYLELGAVQSDNQYGIADKIPGKPTFGSGFTSMIGARRYF